MSPGRGRALDARRLAAALESGRHAGDREAVAYRRIADEVEMLVRDGRIPLHSRMPGERTLAQAMGLSRTTVAGAYTLLRERGYLTVSQGSQARISLPEGAVDPLEAPEIVAPDDVVDLAYATLPADPELLRRGYAAAVAELPTLLARHGYEPRGLPALREAVARRYTRRGVPTTADHVLVTTGAVRAVALVVDALTVPGDPVLVESPTYPNVLDLLRGHGRRTVPVPFPEHALPGAPGGWDLESMAAATAQLRPPLAYLVPDFHNPTGRLMSEAERRGVCAAARRAGTRLLVDETLVDLALDVPGPPPMAAIDPTVVTVGSASKSFWAGLRIGWIRAEPPVVERLLAARSVDDLGTPVVDQLAAAHVLEAADQVLPERLDRLRAGRAAVLEVLARRLPDWEVTSHAVGGLALWVRLPRPVGTVVCAEALARGVRMVPGSRFGVGGGAERYLRLPFTREAGELHAAMEAVADSYDAVLRGTSTRTEVDPGLRLA